MLFWTFVMSTDALLPKNKHDIESVEALARLGYPAIEPMLPELLTWVRDINWPVARPVAELLASIGTPLVPHLVSVLHGEDGVWKYWCITEIIRFMSPEAQEHLRPELERIALSPSENDVREEVNLAAKEALNAF